MTYYMKYDIRIGSYKVNTLKSVSVKRSVEQLSDTATIVLPGTLVNEALEVNDKIKRGDAVSIDLGYDGYMNHEFSGYVKSINTDDNDIRIECEDALYLFDVSVKDMQYGGKKKPPVHVRTILQDITKQVSSIEKCLVVCDYDFKYSTFTISRATALDVLKKIQEETKANIYFVEDEVMELEDEYFGSTYHKGATLHIHAQYGKGSWSGKTVKYDFSRNVISANLKYKRAEDQKLKVELSFRDQDGNTTTCNYGDGSKVIKKIVNTGDAATMQRLAENEYNLWCYDGYEGDLTGWLIPFCQPTDAVEIIDRSRQYKNGIYYVVATDVEFSASGGRRKVTIGRKI